MSWYKNTGGRLGGTITAGLFIEYFVANNVPWIHLDIAGTAYLSKPEKYLPKGVGSIFTFHVKGGEAEARKVIDSLEIFSNLANVADAKSLVVHPATTTHAQLSDSDLEAAGVTKNQIRLSIGLENADDLIEDLRLALEKI